ncbi:hypothetical protein ACO2Q8_25415 [Larkinella sp. VNQ87]|uniref:hypothetical protein n=1 Tax=Larkinella sp. VNQ87 TaxID=3400921 RepID=UPI003C11CD7D
MKLKFTLLLPSGDLASYDPFVKELGIAFDLVAMLLRSGAELLIIYLEEEDGQKTYLPPNAFDEEPMHERLAALEDQYRAILLPASSGGR